MLNVDTFTPSVIVPAAGLSRRSSKWKLGLPFAGETLLLRALRLGRAVSDNVILVLGHREEESRAIARSVPGVTVVYNPWYRCGLFSSLVTAALRVVGPGAYVLLPDMPLLDREHFAELPLGAGRDVVRPTYRGRPGHPVFLSSRVLFRSLSFPLRSSMPEVLQLYHNHLIPTEDSAVVEDIDTELDYRRLLSHSTSL
jgi:molybdenum cofactor cytidylyltransferase